VFHAYMYARNPTSQVPPHTTVSLKSSRTENLPSQITRGKSPWLLNRRMSRLRRSFPTMGSPRAERSHITCAYVCQRLIEAIEHLPVHVVHVHAGPRFPVCPVRMAGSARRDIPSVPPATPPLSLRSPATSMQYQGSRVRAKKESQ
jgi:hypothetical protein